MPLTKTDTGNAIRGRVTPTKKQKSNCQKVIAKLSFADLNRCARTLHTEGDVRLDMQGQIPLLGANLQVQIGKGTVAAALIANSVLITTDPANQKGVSNGAISVLNQSMDTGTIWELSGSLP